jgi:hypothetical protein
VGRNPRLLPPSGHLPDYPYPQEFLTGDLRALPGSGKENNVHVTFGVPGSASGRAATVAIQSPDLSGRLWDFGNPIINWLFEGSAQGLEANPNGPGTVPIVPNISTTLAVLPGWIEADPEGGPAPPYHFRFALAPVWAR